MPDDVDVVRREIVERLVIDGLPVEVRVVRQVPKLIGDGLPEVEVTSPLGSLPALVLLDSPQPIDWAVVCMYLVDFEKVVTRNGGK